MAWYKNDWVKAILAGTVLFIFWKFYQVFFLLFLSILLAVGLSAVIKFTMEKTGFSRLPSAFIAYALIIVVLAGSGFLLAPSVSSQYDSFVSTLPNALDRLETTVSDFKIPKDVVDPTRYEFFNVRTATNTLSSGVSVMLDMIFILILGIYLAGDPKSYMKMSKKVLSEKQLAKMHESLKWWITGRFASMVIVALLTAVGLSILGIPFSLVLAMIAGLMSFIPNLGPIIAFVPAGIISAVTSLNSFIATAILYIGVQLVETYLITPQIEKQTIDLKPGLSLGTQIVMGTIFGFMGLLLAVPTLVTVRAYLKHL